MVGWHHRVNEHELEQTHASNIYIFFMKLVIEYAIDLWFALLIIR